MPGANQLGLVLLLLLAVLAGAAEAMHAADAPMAAAVSFLR